MRFVILIAAAFICACSPQPVYRRSEAPLPIARIEVDRYVGVWRELARLPNEFERGCVHVSAAYARRDDGRLSVRNTCIDRAGESREAIGRARFVGAPGEGKLKVSFFGPFWGDYWVLQRAENYAWAIVGEPRGRYLWVLARADAITPQLREEMERRVTDLGYRPSDMVWAAP